MPNADAVDPAPSAGSASISRLIRAEPTWTLSVECTVSLADVGCRSWSPKRTRQLGARDTTGCDRYARSWAAVAALALAAGSFAGAAPLTDVDGDGRGELLLRNAKYGSWLYYDIDGQRARLRRVGGATANLAYRIAGVGDFDGDGRPEILLRHHGTGAWIHYAVEGRRTRLTRLTGLTTDMTYRPVAVADFDGDGKDEPLLRNVVDGDWAAYTDLLEDPQMRAFSAPTADLAFRLEGVGDFDGDGADDLLLRHASDGDWRAVDIAGAEDEPDILEDLPTGAEHQPAGIGDFDGDGADELLLRQATAGTWSVRDLDEPEATGTTLRGVTTNLDYTAVAVGDVDGDSDDDLLLRHRQGGWIYYVVTGDRGSLRRAHGATRNPDWRVAGTTSDPLVRADRSIGRYLEAPLEAGSSPGLFAAIYDAHGVRAIAAAGIRKEGAEAAVTITDLVQIGSNTKAMTSTMLATLVADGTFRNGWQTTFADVFPELLDEVHMDYHDATLRQFVTMSGGVRANARSWSAHRDLPFGPRRVALVRDNLGDPRAVASGEFLYSNLSYLVAATMAEKLTGRSWESLMRDRLFGPLHMFRSGFGHPGTVGAVDAPWGHRRDDVTGAWLPTQSANPLVMGPSGAVHAPLDDWGAFAAVWLADGPAVGLTRDALDELTAPAVPSTAHSEYAAGWVVTQRDWAGGTVLTHSGSNLRWHTVMWVAPGIGRAFVAAGNAWDDATHDALDGVIGDLIRHDSPAPLPWTIVVESPSFDDERL